MKLVKKDSGETHDHEHSANHSSTQKLEISTTKQTWIGLETSKVIRKDFDKKIIFAGTVAYDPELYTALTEFKEISKQKNLEGLDHSTQLTNIAYNRLLQMGLSKTGIRFFLQRDPSELVTGARDGRAIIYAQIFEADIGSIQEGLKVKVTCPSYPGIDFDGVIKAMDTIMSAETRTMRSRLLVNDPKSLLKPQMLVEVEVGLHTKNVLAVPSVAIMHTGMRTVIYKRLDSTHFQPVEVLVGKEALDYTEVVQGLEEGDEVVTKANFLLDSESKLKITEPKHSTHDK
jgi:membrane fusion protein, copper/silver efflux system